MIQSPLAPAVLSQFLNFTQRFEGLTTWMYLDCRGLVTIGYGCLIDPYVPHTLDFRAKDGNPVTDGDVAREWTAVKGMITKAPLGGMIFRDLTNLRATLQSVNGLALSRLSEMTGVLVTYFPGLVTWPQRCQLALVSMAWACGPNFSTTWPRFTAAANKQDWATCAVECHMDTSKNAPLIARDNANRDLFLNALKPL